MKSLKHHLTFSVSQRRGLVFLFATVIVLQLFYYFSDFSATTETGDEKLKWLSLQTEIDSLKKHRQEKTVTIYPFNPNFITDFKGYRLGMSVVQIDRLLAFR